MMELVRKVWKKVIFRHGSKDDFKKNRLVSNGVATKKEKKVRQK